jgi:hypothetical protein
MSHANKADKLLIKPAANPDSAARLDVRIVPPTMEVIDVWVRVVRFEGGTPEGLDAEIADVKEQMANASSGGPPSGLEGVKRAVMAVNREEGTGLGLTFCDTEEELRDADEALNNMSPSSDSSGRRVSAGVYEVVIDQQMT